jgi:GT2 family glycosyltransferase
MSSAPWLSLIMPTRNGARYLPAALASVVAQDDRELEVLLVDDGSTDATLRIARQFADHIPLRLLQRHAGNWAANTNFAMRQARGEYLTWLHQDDLWLPGRLAKLRQWAGAFPTAQLLAHPVWFIDRHATCRGRWNFPLAPRQPTLFGAEAAARDVAGSLLVQNWIATPATLFHADAARRAGYRDEQLWYAADWDFWLKLALAGPVLLSPEPLACFRIHAESQTVARGPAAEDLRRQHDRVLERHLPGWSARHPDRRAVPQAARLSVEVNLALRQLFFGRAPRLGPLGKSAAGMTPQAWMAYLRHATLRARCLGRLRARLTPARLAANGVVGAEELPWTHIQRGQE